MSHKKWFLPWIKKIHVRFCIKLSLRIKMVLRKLLYLNSFNKINLQNKFYLKSSLCNFRPNPVLISLAQQFDQSFVAHVRYHIVFDKIRVYYNMGLMKFQCVAFAKIMVTYCNSVRFSVHSYMQYSPILLFLF